MVTIPTGTWVDGNVDAGELRKSLGAALIVPGGPTAPRPGRLAGPGTPLTVSPTAPASMAVLVKAGKAHTYRSAAYGPTLGIGPDGDVTIPIVAPASGSQWYRVYLNQRDPSAPANDADGLAVVDAVAGVAASSPTKPNLPAGALLLGEVLVPAGAASITAAMVTDLPTWTAPRGGVLPVANQAERVALQTAGLVWPTLEVLELDTGRRLWHDGTRFRYDGDRITVLNVADRDALTAYTGLLALVSGTSAASVYNGTAWVPLNDTWTNHLADTGYNLTLTPTYAAGANMTFARTVPVGRSLEIELSIPKLTLSASALSEFQLNATRDGTTNTIDAGTYSTGAGVSIYTGVKLAGSIIGTGSSVSVAVMAWAPQPSVVILASNGAPVRLRSRIV